MRKRVELECAEASWEALVAASTASSTPVRRLVGELVDREAARFEAVANAGGKQSANLLDEEASPPARKPSTRLSAPLPIGQGPPTVPIR